MIDKSHESANIHHLGPFSGCAIVYMPLEAAHSAECPVTYLWEQAVEPDSEPIWRLHTHDAVEVGYCHEGAGILVVEDGVLHFSAGDISVIGEQQMHMSRREVSTPCRWSYFWLDRGLLLAGMPEGLELVGSSPMKHPDFPYIFSPASHPQLCAMVRDIIDELSVRGFGHRGVAKSYASAFMILLHRMYQNRPGDEALPARDGIERVVPALHYMTSHYTESVEANVLAKLCNLSLSHFRRIFLAATGRTPMEYLGQLRARMAATLLIGSNKPVSQIAYEVGFESINTFNRQFRSQIGVTPRQWRSEHRAN